MRNRYCGLQRLTDNVGQIILSKASSICKADRMHKEEHRKLLGFRKKRLKARIVEVDTVDVSGDLNCVQTKVAHEALKLWYCLSNVLEGKGAHSGKTRRIGSHDFCHAVVLHA